VIAGIEPSVQLSNKVILYLGWENYILMQMCIIVNNDARLEKISSMPMSSSNNLKNITCVGRASWREWSMRGVGTKGLVGILQSKLKMWLVWREVRILAQTVLPQGMDFSLFYYHTCAAVYYMCCKYASCAIHIFHLCKVKIDQVTEIQNTSLFWGL
jgi:hypothetical protein